MSKIRTDQQLLYILRENAMCESDSRPVMNRNDLIDIANGFQDKIRQIAELKQCLKECNK